MFSRQMATTDILGIKQCTDVRRNEYVTRIILGAKEIHKTVLELFP